MAFKPLHDRVAGSPRTESERENRRRADHPRQRQRKAGGRRSCCSGRRRPQGRCGELIEMAVKAGDKVLFGKWSGTEDHPRR